MTNPSPLLERIAQADHVTLEIGTGRDPLMNNSDRPFDQSNMYIGLNIDPMQHDWLASVINGHLGMVAMLGTRDANGHLEETPLLSGSIDTVHISNVFGEPDNPGIMLLFHDENHVYHGHSTELAKIAMLDEVRRVLKDDGELVIIEDLTPYGDDSPEAFGQPRYKKLANILEEHGFTITAAAGDPESFKIAAADFRFGFFDDLGDPSSYLLRAHKQ